jgi:hypothetical protein
VRAGEWKVRGRADGSVEGLALQVEARPPSGEIDALATLSAHGAYRGRLRVGALDPGALLVAAPHGSIALEASAAGQGKAGTLTLERLSASSLGAHLAAHGAVRSDGNGELFVDAGSRDLSALGRQGGATLAGAFSLKAHVVRETRLVVEGALSGTRLSGGHVQVEHLVARLRSRDLGGDVQLRAAGLRLGRARFDSLTVAAHGDGAAFALRVDGAGPHETWLRVRANGTPLPKDGRPRGADVRLTQLRLAWRNQDWRMLVPARLRFDRGVSVERLRLASGPQQIAVDARLARGRTDSHVHTEDLDLSSIVSALRPDLVLPRTRISADLAVSGSTREPLAELSVRANSDRDVARGLDPIRLSADASYDSHTGRARLSSVGEAAGQILSAQLDLPLRLRPTARIAADVSLRAGAQNLCTRSCVT